MEREQPTGGCYVEKEDKMADLPLTWQELRHREGAEASADVPEEMLGLVREEEPPKREMRFLNRLDRPASYERGADGALTLEGYPLPWVTSSYLPKRARTPIPRTVLHHDQRLEPAIVYPPTSERSTTIAATRGGVSAR